MRENSKMYSVKITLTKIDKDVLFKSDKTGAIYLDAVMFVNEEKDQYGNNGSIMQSYPEDKRPETPNYIGNIKLIEKEPVKSAEVDDNDLPWD